MKHHKYYNTIWSNRDEEFWWDGIKSGFTVATILTSALWIDSIMLLHYIKKRKNRERIES